MFDSNWHFSDCFRELVTNIRGNGIILIVTVTEGIVKCTY